jgi:hypothetical protein
MVFLLLNGAVTVVCGLIIAYYAIKKKVTESFFHYAWATGFLVYGLEILLKAGGFSVEIAQALFYFAFVLLIIGILYLCRAKQLIVILGIGLTSLLIFSILVLCGIIPYSFLEFIVNTVIFLFVVVAIIQHRILFGKSANLLAIGWILLFLTNVLLQNSGWISDAFAVTAKIIILLGVLDYDFVVIADKARARRHSAPDAEYEQEGGLKLLTSVENSNTTTREVNWIKEKISENAKEGLETIIFAFQDVFPHKELRAIKRISPEKVSVFLFSSSAQKAKTEFIVLPMGLAQIGSAFSQATSQCQKTDKGCTVVFLHLSLLIQVFGAEAVYNMLLNKMGYLRENGINLYAVFYPIMHSDQSIISLYTRLADESIKL